MKASGWKQASLPPWSQDLAAAAPTRQQQQRRERSRIRDEQGRQQGDGVLAGVGDLLPYPSVTGGEVEEGEEVAEGGGQGRDEAAERWKELLRSTHR